jgi:hypothetical protein
VEAVKSKNHTLVNFWDRTVRITAKGLRKCSSKPQVDVCSQGVASESCSAIVSQDTVIDLEAKIEELESVLRDKIERQRTQSREDGMLCQCRDEIVA